MRAVRYILAGAALCLGTAAFGANNTANNNGFRYKWKDASGHSYFSDSLTQEAMAAGYDVVNAQGVTVRHVDRQLTADERAAAKKVADQQAAAQQAEQQRQRDDAQMLNAYPTEAAFVSAKTAEGMWPSPMYCWTHAISSPPSFLIRRIVTRFWNGWIPEFTISASVRALARR